MDNVQKFNPHHDSKGRFASKGGAASVTPEQHKANVVQSFKDLKSRGVLLRGVFGVSPKSGDSLDLDALAESWAKHVKGNVQPHEVLDALIGSDKHVADLDASADDAAIISMTFDTDGKLAFHGTNVQVFGTPVKVITRDFDFNKKDVEHTFLEVHEGERGSGMGKRLFQSAVPLYKRMGLESISTYANLDAGGYVWGRFGFTSRDGSALSDLGMATRDRLAERVPDKSLLPPKARKEWDALHQFLDKSEKLATSADPKDNEQAAHFPHAYTGLRMPNLAKALGHKGTDPGKSLMKDLLHKTGWNGEIRFNDPVAMATLNKYVGFDKRKKK